MASFSLHWNSFLRRKITHTQHKVHVLEMNTWLWCKQGNANITTHRPRIHCISESGRWTNYCRQHKWFLSPQSLSTANPVTNPEAMPPRCSELTRTSLLHSPSNVSCVILKHMSLCIFMPCLLLKTQALLFRRNLRHFLMDALLWECTIQYMSWIWLLIGPAVGS